MKPVFKHYTEYDYEAVCDFLIELNHENQYHINWNWGRFEWMMKHPEFDESLMGSIGLWMDGEKVAGQTETIMRFDLDKALPVDLPGGIRFAELDPVKEPVAFQWLMWQGFDHGSDKAEFERDGDVFPEIPEFRKHFDSTLSIAAKSGDGDYVSYCCLWYSGKTDYAYVEPVCTVPSFRGKGVAKAVIYEALNRVRSLGANHAYVLSDMPFYEKLGFRKDKRFTFFWKR